MHLKFTAADKTDVGKQREQNEDCAYKRVESSEEGDRACSLSRMAWVGIRQERWQAAWP